MVILAQTTDATWFSAWKIAIRKALLDGLYPMEKYMVGELSGPVCILPALEYQFSRSWSIQP